MHALRVETRRLLAAVDLVEPFVSEDAGGELRRRLRKLQKRTAALRDVQVQITRLEKCSKRFPQTAPFYKALCRREEKILAGLVEKLPRQSLAEIKRGMKSFQNLLEASFTSVQNKEAQMPTLLARATAAWHRVEALRRRIRPSDSATIHRTRVAFKRFRYMMELLGPMLPTVGRQTSREMRRYQSLMGDIQDTEVLRSTLAKYLRKHPKKAPLLAAFQRDLTRQRSAQVCTFLASAGRLALFRPPVTPAPARARARRSRKPQVTR